MPKSITVQTAAGPRDIAAVWVGDNLAVHRPPLRDGAKPAPKQWAITHTASGLSMGAPLCARKDSAVALARLWDSAAGEIDARNPRGWRFLQTWQLDVAAAENRRIAPLEGPVLPDNPGPQDVAAAICGAASGGRCPHLEKWKRGRSIPSLKRRTGARLNRTRGTAGHVSWGCADHARTIPYRVRCALPHRGAPALSSHTL